MLLGLVEWASNLLKNFKGLVAEFLVKDALFKYTVGEGLGCEGVAIQAPNGVSSKAYSPLGFTFSATTRYDP